MDLNKIGRFISEERRNKISEKEFSPYHKVKCGRDFFMKQNA